ncbi:virulence factor BrkB family protein [Haemophilus haemoglobinophilus]|nr:virulence factor BrkB family protein [Canicola haemoglobinophilus]
MSILLRNLVAFFKVFLYRFKQNKLNQAAGYLTYSTMLAFVPLIMVFFSIFTAFPVFNEVTGELKQFIFTNFAPSASDVVGEYIDQFVNNSKQMSAVGIISLIVVALMLINSIDRTLNSIWHDTSVRPAVFSFAIYWLILTLGPIIIATSIGISTYATTFATRTFEQDLGLPIGIKLLGLLPFFLTWFIFTILYMVVPNKKVSVVHSAAGALIAAVFFTLGKQAFTWYITNFPSYQLIYGAMATLPIMLLWIQLSWTAILLGAQLSAVLADMRSLDCGDTQIEKIKEEK